MEAEGRGKMAEEYLKKREEEEKEKEVKHATIVKKAEDFSRSTETIIDKKVIGKADEI